MGGCTCVQRKKIEVHSRINMTEHSHSESVNLGKFSTETMNFGYLATNSASMDNSINQIPCPSHLNTKPILIIFCMYSSFF